MQRLLGVLTLALLVSCGPTPVTNVSGLAPVATSGSYADLTDAPTLSKVATTGSYADLTHAPALSPVATTGVYADLTGAPALSAIATSGAYADLSGAPALSAVATSGSYADLTGTPTLAAIAATGNYSDLVGAPVLARVGTTGAYSDLAGTPALSSVALSGSYADLQGKPALATVALSGSYADLSGRPALSPVATSGAYADLSGKPTLATVATSGAYADLTGTPTLATIASSGAYADLTGTPTLSAVASSGSYADLSGQPWTADATGLRTAQTVAIGGAASTSPLSVSIPALATPVVDQSSPQNGNAWPVASLRWQSFTPAVSGNLAGLTVSLWGGGSAGSFTLELYEGDGPVGAPVYSQPGISLPAYTTTTIALTTPFRLWRGNLYTWVLTSSAPFEIVGYAWGDYPGGHADDPGAAGQHPDYTFETRMNQDPARLEVSASGAVGVGTASPTATLDVAGSIRIRDSRTPAPGSACDKGDQAWDADYVYVCIATNTWRRAALSAY